MALELVTLPCLTDNFAFLLNDRASGETALIDAPEAGPVLHALEERDWQLGQILLTHHHADHVQGVDEIRAATGAKVLGASADAHRLPALDRALQEGDRVQIGAEDGRVIDVSGHTIGHIAFHFPQSAMVCRSTGSTFGSFSYNSATTRRHAAYRSTEWASSAGVSSTSRMRSMCGGST